MLEGVGDQNHTFWQGKNFFTSVHEQGSEIYSCYAILCQNSYLFALTEEMWPGLDRTIENEREILHLYQNFGILTLLKERCEIATI